MSFWKAFLISNTNFNVDVGLLLGIMYNMASMHWILALESKKLHSVNIEFLIAVVCSILNISLNFNTDNTLKTSHECYDTFCILLWYSYQIRSALLLFNLIKTWPFLLEKTTFTKGNLFHVLILNQYQCTNYIQK